jgi:hypothetical protein
VLDGHSEKEFLTPTTTPTRWPLLLSASLEYAMALLKVLCLLELGSPAKMHINPFASRFQFFDCIAIKGEGAGINCIRITGRGLGVQSAIR